MQTNSWELSCNNFEFATLQGTAGLSFGKPEEKLGWNAQPTCSVIMDDVRVSAADRLGEEGTGFNIAMNACESSVAVVA